MWDHGFLDHRRKTFKSPSECRVDKPLGTKTRTLTLFDLSEAFFIFGVGLSLSAFCFFVELFSKYAFLLAQGRVSNSKASVPPTEEALQKEDIEIE